MIEFLITVDFSPLSCVRKSGARLTTSALSYCRRLFMRKARLCCEPTDCALWSPLELDLDLDACDISLFAPAAAIDPVSSFEL